MIVLLWKVIMLMNKVEFCKKKCVSTDYSRDLMTHVSYMNIIATSYYSPNCCGIY